MTWYRTGTVALVSGQTAITGTGTQWLTQTKAGDALLGPDGKLYELLTVVSDTQATLATPYAGASAPATPYVIVPTQSITRLLSSQVSELIALYAAVPESIAEATTAAVALATAASQEAAEAAAQSAADAEASSESIANGPVASVAGKNGVVTLVKADVGLGSVDNTADSAKPVSTATAAALAAKEPTITAGTNTQFWRGDKTWQDFAGAVRAAMGNIASAAGFSVSLGGTGGYIKFPSWLGGVVLQWGRVITWNPLSGAAVVSFPMTFPTSCIAVLPVGLGGYASNLLFASYVNWASVSTSAVEIFLRKLEGVSGVTPVGNNDAYAYWFAIGH